MGKHTSRFGHEIVIGLNKSNEHVEIGFSEPLEHEFTSIAYKEYLRLLEALKSQFGAMRVKVEYSHGLKQP